MKPQQKPQVTKIAAFNVENLFNRARVMNLDSWAEGESVLNQYCRINALLVKPKYSERDKREIVQALTALGLGKSDDGGKFALLRQNHGRLLKRPQGGAPEVVAEGRGDWVGWVELKEEAVHEVATEMTARVIQDVNADIVAVVEAEDRITLKHFNEQLLRPLGVEYSSVMAIDGNDERGIDVGLLAKGGYEIASMVSHVDDRDKGKAIFSRDCPEYAVRRAGGLEILVLVNHFKSKGYGAADDANARRKAQARRVREIYELRRSQGHALIVVAGDLNDTPLSDPLSPLLADGSDLRDISTHPRFQGDGRPGTYQSGTKSDKIDYLLLSPALYDRVQAGGVWRKGVWAGAKGDIFPHYPEIETPAQAASDHAALWAELDL